MLWHCLPFLETLLLAYIIITGISFCTLWILSTALHCIFFGPCTNPHGVGTIPILKIRKPRFWVFKWLSGNGGEWKEYWHLRQRAWVQMLPLRLYDFGLFHPPGVSIVICKKKELDYMVSGSPSGFRPMILRLAHCHSVSKSWLQTYYFPPIPRCLFP